MSKDYPKPPNPRYFNDMVPLPLGLSKVQLAEAMIKVQDAVALVNKTFKDNGIPPMVSIVQKNNFSGIISNLFSNALDSVTSYKSNSPTAHPDLIDPDTGIGIEVKATIDPGKGGEGHNGHSGWHIVAVFDTDEDSGNIQFVQLEVADLIGYEHGEVDWKFCQGTFSSKGHTGHIETYMTTPQGTQKLRDGSVYLDPSVVDLSRCRIPRGHTVPEYSPMYNKLIRSRQSQQRLDQP